MYKKRRVDLFHKDILKRGEKETGESWGHQELTESLLSEADELSDWNLCGKIKSLLL